MTSPFARNVLTAAVASTLLLVICGTYYRHNYILKLHIDNVDVHTYGSHAVGTAGRSIWNKQIYIRDNS